MPVDKKGDKTEEILVIVSASLLFSWVLHLRVFFFPPEALTLPIMASISFLP